MSLNSDEDVTTALGPLTTHSLQRRISVKEKALYKATAGANGIQHDVFTRSGTMISGMFGCNCSFQASTAVYDGSHMVGIALPDTLWVTCLGLCPGLGQ